MKNLNDNSTRDELIARINKLTPATKAVWGKMNVNQGLRHMTYALQIATGEMKIAPRKVPLPKFLMKYFLLNFQPPKGKANTFPEVDVVKNNIHPPDFVAEQKALKDAVQSFSQRSLIEKNPMGISFSKDDWGKLNYNHTDHHLRQFGV